MLRSKPPSVWRKKTSRPRCWTCAHSSRATARVRAVLAARAEQLMRVRPQSWRTARPENGCGLYLQPAQKEEKPMAVEVVMPQMGESIFEGTVTKWLKKP